jgi:hypothetical protein
MKQSIYNEPMVQLGSHTGAVHLLQQGTQRITRQEDPNYLDRLTHIRTYAMLRDLTHPAVVTSGQPLYGNLIEPLVHCICFVSLCFICFKYFNSPFNISLILILTD